MTAREYLSQIIPMRRKLIIMQGIIKNIGFEYQGLKDVNRSHSRNQSPYTDHIKQAAQDIFEQKKKAIRDYKELSEEINRRMNKISGMNNSTMGVLLYRVYCEGRTAKELSQELGYSSGTIYNLRMKALKEFETQYRDELQN